MTSADPVVSEILDLAAAARSTPDDLSRVAARMPPDAASTVLGAALDPPRGRAFTRVLLAALHSGYAVDAAILTEGAALLPDAIHLATICGHLTGDVGSALIAAVAGQRLGAAREPSALLIAQCWAERHRRPPPEGLIALARVRARRQGTPAGEDALVALGGLLDDPHLDALLSDLSTPEIRRSAHLLAESLVLAMVGPVLDPILGPIVNSPPPSPTGPVRRAAPKIGRNAACWCGSGRKYKACHEGVDLVRRADASEVVGVTASELADAPTRHLPPDRVATLRPHVLARLEPGQIPAGAAEAVAVRLARHGYTAAALAVIRQHGPDDLDDAARHLAEHAARLGHRHILDEIVATRTAGAEGLALEARLARRDPADWLARIEADARSEVDATGVDLGLGLIAAGLPGLGIFVARGQLALHPPGRHADVLQYALLEARDALLLSPWDPIDHVLFTLDQGLPPEVEHELQAARSQLDQAEGALATTQRSLRQLKAQIAATPPSASDPPAADPAPPRPDPAVRDLRARLDRLKGELKDRHRERNALRRDLDAARRRVVDLERPAPPEEAAAADRPPDDTDADTNAEIANAGEVGSRVRIPRFPDGFAARIAAVPEATARATMTRIGALCAGHSHAFRECRRLRRTEDTWRAKIGRSYRLLFRLEGGTLWIVDLIHRQDLDRRISRRKGGLD